MNSSPNGLTCIGQPGFKAAEWYDLLLPVKTPQSIVHKVHKDVSAVLCMPDVRDPRVADTIEPSLFDTPRALLAFYAAEANK